MPQIEVIDKYIEVAQALYSNRVLFFKECYGWTPTTQQGDVLTEMDKYDAPPPGMPTDPNHVGPYVDHWAIASGNGTGKTDMVAGLIPHYHVTRPNSVVLATASSAPQLHNGLWPRVTSRLNDMRKTPLGKILSQSIIKNQERMFDKGNPDGHYVIAQTADKSNVTSLMGMHPPCFAVFGDEASNIDDECHDAIERDFGHIESKYVFIGNPLKTSGRFFDMFHDDKQFWNTRNWSVLDSEVGDKHWAHRMIAKHGKDSRIVLINVYGQFPKNDEESMIRYDMAKAAVERQVEIDMSAPVVMAVDPAYSHDTSVIACRKGEVMLPWKQIKKYSANPAMQIAKEVAIMASKMKPKAIIVDANGYGNGIADILDNMGYPVIKTIVQQKDLIPDDKKPEFATNGDWLMGEFRDWLYEVEGSIWDNEDKDFIAQIITPRFDMATRRVESKKAAKARCGTDSWDILDAHKLLFAINYAELYENMTDDDENAYLKYQSFQPVLDAVGGY